VPLLRLLALPPSHPIPALPRPARPPRPTGELFSDDDLYMTSSRLVVLETTNHIYNPKVFRALTPHSVLSWQRVRTALLLARSGEEWVHIFKKHNSGTYNNQ
jgi:hypothetical protein